MISVLVYLDERKGDISSSTVAVITIVPVLSIVVAILIFWYCCCRKPAGEPQEDLSTTNDGGISLTVLSKFLCILFPSCISTSPLFKNLKLLKLTDIVKLNNIVFSPDKINGKTPPTLES